MEEDLNEDCVDCGNISEGKADWLLEKACDLIPEDPEQIILSQHEHLLSDKIHNIIKEVLQENRVWLKLSWTSNFSPYTALKMLCLVCPLARWFAHIFELW